MITAYDTAANAWPSDTEYALCYLNGLYANVSYVRQHFPKASILTIDVTGVGEADIVDVESGDATPAVAAAGLEEGRYRAAYASLSTGAQIGALMSRPWNYFAADPTGTPHFPAATRLATVIGCQYAWAQLGQTQGRNIDISVVSESFFGIAPTPPPTPSVSLDPLLELIVSLSSSPTDALNVFIRNAWATYRSDTLSVPALEYLHAGYNGPWAGSLDFVLATIIDTATETKHLRPAFAGAA